MKKGNLFVWSCILTGLVLAIVAFCVLHFFKPKVPVGAPAIPPQHTQQTNSNAPTQNASSIAISQKQPDAASASSSQKTEASSSKKNNAKNVVHGVITGVSSSNIVVEDESTKEQLYFGRESAEVEGRLVEGAKVEVHYTGDIKNNDTSGVYVFKIISEVK